MLDAIAARANASSSVLPTLLGAGPWIASRAAGITAFVGLTLVVSLGVFVSTGLADPFVARAKVMDAHRWLSSVTLGLVALHAAALLGDRFVRFDVLDLAIPFLTRHRPVAVGLGVVASYGLWLVHASASWRAALGAAGWRALHRASALFYAGALAHGLLAGTDSRALAPLYVSSSLIVGALVLLRLSRPRGPAPRGRSVP
ncbi:MAG: ferric reductase-like transmembrane domain-containing protein [Sandaracinaceae bacterium]|nr:ferric reductase-like transmembrane domain-containing protein [Sandaracinaceae bacterium]